MTAKSDKTQLIERVLELEEKVYRALRPIVPKEWLSVDLTMPQLKVLLLLFTDGPARMSVLASALSVSMTTTTGIIDRMVQHGLLVRDSDPEDRRAVVCKLSDKGQELMTCLWEVGQTRMRSLLDKMTLLELHTISEVMETILDAMGTMEKDLRLVGDTRKSEK